MARQSSITFANLTCRFGQNYVLLDFAEQIVLPALLDPSLGRKFGETRYLFLNTSWATFDFEGDDGIPELCVFGQIVKDTVLHSDQVLEDGQLIPNSESIRSAPSSFFVLLLSNHKLIFLPETAGAPSLDTFASTLQSFLRIKHRQYIDAEYNLRKQSESPVTKLSLYEEIPPPIVEVLPLASRESIEAFVASIKTLTHLEFRVVETNNEFQMRGPYERIRHDKEALGAKVGKLIYDNPEGLNKTEVANQIELSAAAGNQKVIVAGTDEYGAKKRGDNDKFSLQLPVGDLPEDPPRRAFALLEQFRNQRTGGNIVLDAGADTSIRMLEIRNHLTNGTDNNNNF